LKTIKNSITNECIKRGWLKEIYTGHWIFYEPLSTLLVLFKEFFSDSIKEKLKIQEVLFPKIIPLNLYEKYGKKFYPTNLALQIKKNPKEISTVLDPALTVAYSSLNDSIIPIKNLPILYNEIDISASFRNEKRSLKEFSRSVEYYKSDFIFLGTPEQVSNIHEITVNAFKDCLSKLELKIFLNSKILKIKSEGKYLNIIDFLFRYEKQSLEIASAANRRTWVTSKYNIRNSENKPMWSGYLSIGLTRILYSFLSSNGFEDSNWPIFINKK
jgi:seryl-tRNA synthetase